MTLTLVKDGYIVKWKSTPSTTNFTRIFATYDEAERMSNSIEKDGYYVLAIERKTIGEK